MKSIGAINQKILVPFMQRHPHWRLMVQWPCIVGASLASMTWPQKIIEHPLGGILYLEIPRESLLEVWSASCTIIERVNQVFGFQVIRQIRMQPKDDVGGWDDKKSDEN